ncbi:MAG: DUF11 domain-containing protein [Anaerolineae bacterium]|nr:DUF11 domain-containing protein [Anaerolineae bacterium]
MRLKILQGFILVTTVVFASIIILSPVPKADAASLLQDAPSLDGYKIYFTEANGEASRFDRSASGLSRLAGLLSELGAQMETVEWRTQFPTDADLIIVAGPMVDLDASQTARLWEYITGGGKVLLLVDPLRIERGRGVGVQLESGLMQLLWTDLGMRVRNDIVLTEGFMPIQPLVATPMPEQTPEATAEAVVPPVVEPPPILNFTTTDVTADQPILAGITEPLAFFNARSIEIDLSVREFPVQPLVFSSGEFYGENNLAAFNEGGVALYNIGEDISPGFLPLATAFENSTSGTRIVLISDRDFATNGSGLQSSPPNTGAFLYPGNVRFLLNSVAWLLGAEKVDLTFPTPGPTATPTLIPTPAVIDPLAVQTDLAVTVSVSNIRPVEGEIIIYDITVVNNGPETAELIEVTDDLPAGIQYIMASGGAFDGEVNKWIIDSLEPNQGTSLRLVVGVLRGTVGTTITNQVTVSSELLTDIDPNNNAATAEINIERIILADQEPQPTQEGG